MLATLAFAAQLLTLAPQYATVGRPRTRTLPLPLPLTPNPRARPAAHHLRTTPNPNPNPTPTLNPTPNANPTPNTNPTPNANPSPNPSPSPSPSPNQVRHLRSPGVRGQPGERHTYIHIGERYRRETYITYAYRRTYRRMWTARRPHAEPARTARTPPHTADTPHLTPRCALHRARRTR